MSEPQVWQIACGEPQREYASLFLDHDLMFMGPGNLGRYSRAIYPRNRKHAMIRQFYEEVLRRDIVLMRRGSRVIAVGLVVDNDAVWREWLDDVYGWDLQHSKRVIWQHQLTEQLVQIQATQPLLRGRRPTLSRVSDPKVVERVSHLLPGCEQRPFRDLPAVPGDILAPNEFGNALFARGLPRGVVDRVVGAIEHARRMLDWYQRDGKASSRPDEHEVVAHLVLPLMIALGWSEQMLAIEWHKVDLAAFRGSPTTAQTCVLACEAKRMGSGLLDKVYE